jgi:hypothetical protein
MRLLTAFLAHDSRLLCQHSHGYEDTAAGKGACGTRDPAGSRLFVNETACFFFRRISCKRSAFKVVNFVCFSQPSVYGKRPRPTAAFLGRENLNYVTSVFEPFHLSFTVGTGKTYGTQFTDNSRAAALSFARAHQYPAGGVSSPMLRNTWICCESKQLPTEGDEPCRIAS